uniref:Molybdenum cofactor sulfurase n=1 Tax=Cyprinus carpio TaxID=7962 RepID=A0A8C1IWA2_CYPCA
RNVCGNPHSHYPSSRHCGKLFVLNPYRILEHFNTYPEDYSVIFTSGCTAALKLVADTFRWKTRSNEGPGRQFCYLTDNHTSVVGIRGVTALQGVGTVSVLPHEVETRVRKPPTQTNGEEESSAPHLFCYLAQSNFSGRKYPLSYVKGIQSQQLHPACEHPGRWSVLLDAACFVSCSPLDLSQYPADFVPISFYKMFGFPTGLRALLVRNEAAEVLRKTYFGGGTAEAYLVAEDYFVPKPNVVSRFEDGTISFLDIISLHHGFETLIYTIILRSVRNCHVVFKFILITCKKKYIYKQYIYKQILQIYNVDKMASLFNIHIRTGCFSNTGACQHYLVISNQNLKTSLHVRMCHSSIRVSFGYMSSFEDCQNFLWFVVNCFVDKPLILDQKRLTKLKSAEPMKSALSLLQRITPSEDTVSKEGKKNNGSSHTLTNLFIYPVKSCASFEVTEWPLGPQGLLYDRLWMAVNENGVCFSQKREPKLCLIRPVICLASNTLQLQVSGMEAVTVPLETSLTNSDLRTSQSKVCGDRYEDKTQAHPKNVFILYHCIVQEPEFLWDMKFGRQFTLMMSSCPTGDCGATALSLVNEAQFLLINRVSVSFLQEHIATRHDSVNEGTCHNQPEFKQMHRSFLDVLFKVIRRCSRCQMIGVDQKSATRTQEPLRSLSECKSGKVTFGVYLAHQSARNTAVLVLSVGACVIPRISESTEKP